ncbi:helix-turn-helix transcriptional regulator, partial [Klebsiella pneumoniae]|nr:helix-turn-helix transcriptional regulator [Klebsiella pneumoniae]
KLPARQLEILKLTMEGKSAWVVGTLLGISENTVNYHMKQLFKQLDVSTKQAAVLKAMELGLL